MPGRCGFAVSPHPPCGHPLPRGGRVIWGGRSWRRIRGCVRFGAYVVSVNEDALESAASRVSPHPPCGHPLPRWERDLGAGVGAEAGNAFGSVRSSCCRTRMPRKVRHRGEPSLLLRRIFDRSYARPSPYMDRDAIDLWSVLTCIAFRQLNARDCDEVCCRYADWGLDSVRRSAISWM